MVPYQDAHQPESGPIKSQSPVLNPYKQSFIGGKRDHQKGVRHSQASASLFSRQQSDPFPLLTR